MTGLKRKNHESPAREVDETGISTRISTRALKTRHVLSWLESNGAALNDLFVDESPHGGLGVFTPKRVGASKAVFSLPRKLLLSMDKLQIVSISDVLSEELRAASREPALENLGAAPLWLELMLAREMPHHSFHVYATSLPYPSPDALSWPVDRREALLTGTNIGDSLLLAEKKLAVLFKVHLAPLLKAYGLTDAANTLEGFIWARGAYLSRGFPTELARDTEASSSITNRGSLACFVPFLDLLNHSEALAAGWASEKGGADARATSGDSTSTRSDGAGCAKVHWDVTTDAEFLTFRCGDITAGSEVFNTYGSKSNEQLLMAYGFCVRRNPEDVFQFRLAIDLSEEPCERASAKRLLTLQAALLRSCPTDSPHFGIAKDGLSLVAGPYQIRRGEAGGVPPSLILSCAVLAAEHEELDSALLELSDDLDISVDLRAFEILKAQLQLHLSSLEALAGQDADVLEEPPVSRQWDEKHMQNYSAACYREGQREILTEAMAELSSVLSVA
ncbi:hypothetical protein CYMTET_41771 [Cymbomonas tetramitiformis]|uniref:SET domain-containing protein n=1 Tax=Cymbomonas tetramitiformis TaxID=36881 RepID=A0AAE0F392_9CHLO|nr:hypothetical protein CYMTET_41771 [Cymbomonas tetramitiformis]|eukprot:gene20852-24999_t